MRYSFEFKMMCVELYKQGKWPETPSGVKPHTFHTKINYWSRLVDEHGPQILMHSGYNKTWSPEDKYVFCKCKFLKFADKNGEFCISVLEKVAGCPAGLPDAS